jgi:hypothetical protein
VKSNASESLPFPLNCASKTYFYVARSGIYHLARALGLDKGGMVLVPDYHHGNEIYALRAAGARLRYYPIKKNLQPDLDAVAKLCEENPQVLYVTHFIGFPQPMAELQALCRNKGIMLIEDCALSFMSEYDRKPLGTFGDHSVFCLYKSLPVPNGGVLATNRPLPPQREGEKAALGEGLNFASKLSVAARSIELTLQWLRSRYETSGRALFTLKRAAGRTLNAGRVRRVPVGDTGFDLSIVNVGMSPICHTLLPRFEYNWIKETRRRNFRILQERLGETVSLLDVKLDDGVCPLFFPLLVKDKQSASRVLGQSGIETVEFWNRGDTELEHQKSDANFLRRHVLEVPIHQDVTAGAAERMAEEIIRLRIGLAS